MSLLGNIIWLLCGGFIAGSIWIMIGILLSITIIGLPLGLQCFKFASLTFFPFGKDILYGSSDTSFIFNVIWLLLVGFENALACFVTGVVLSLTIIGIPFGKQFFKIGKLWLMPFGASIIQY